MVRQLPHSQFSSVPGKLPPLENGDRLTRPEFERLDWYQLVDGEYRSLSPDSNGIIRSQTFSGLWLAVENLLSSQMAQVLTVLQQGLKSPEHAAFVERLQIK